MKRIILIAVVAFVLSACTAGSHAIANSSNGEVITDMKARATGGGGSFDGTVDNMTDLDDLVATAWGTGRLGLHRGHRPIGRVLEVFLGISHEQMHFYMEEKNLNLAGVCEELGYDADNLIESLTNSFAPYIDEAVSKGVITAVEATAWRAQIQEQFRQRVYWRG